MLVIIAPITTSSEEGSHGPSNPCYNISCKMQGAYFAPPAPAIIPVFRIQTRTGDGPSNSAEVMPEKSPPCSAGSPNNYSNKSHILIQS